MAIMLKLATATILLCSSVLAGPAANPKANEYMSSDCSGSMKFGHGSLLLQDVTMNDDSHSVYLATGLRNWTGWSEKTRDGGGCTGDSLGTLNGECVNLDTVKEKRIKCVRYGNN